MKKVLLTATVQSHICQFHRPLVEMLHEQGIEVHVAARDNLAEKNGLVLDFVDKVFDVPFARSPKSTDNIKAYKQVKKIIDEGEYDVVHCNTPMGGIVTRLAALKARRKGTKVFYTAHGFHFYKGAPKKNWLFFYPIEKFFSRITDTLITITKEDYELASKKFGCKVVHIHGVGANSDKFYVISNEEKEQIRKELNLGLDTKVILNVGELLLNKNQKSIILAMPKIIKELPNVKLFIAGNGPEKENIELLIKQHNLENSVILLGYTTELQKYMNICDVLVACSYREGLPVNLMEAMLCGKPIVASDNRGHRELVQNEVNGYIVGKEDIDAYAKQVVNVLQNKKISSEDCLKVVEPFKYENVKEELREIYK